MFQKGNFASLLQAKYLGPLGPVTAQTAPVKYAPMVKISKRCFLLTNVLLPVPYPPPPQAKTAAAQRAGGSVWRLGFVVFVGALLLAPLRLLIDIGGATAP